MMDEAGRRALRLQLPRLALVVLLAAAGCTGGHPRGGTGAAPATPQSGGGAVAATDPSVDPAPLVRAAGGHSPPRIGAPSAIVVDLDTGAILYTRDPDHRRPIGSLAKIMTAMITLESTRPTDIVTATKLAAAQRPTSLSLRPGDRLNVHDMLYALLLHSANDVAVALAQHISRSVPAFDALMTRRGREIGLANSRFASPSGLNDRGFSTARDVATMTRWALRSPAFTRIVGTRTYRLKVPSRRQLRLRNLNNLLFEYPGTIGVKTGFTYRSHWSLVGAAKRGGVRILVVLIGDPNLPFRDGEALLNYGFRAAAHG
jgi:D-alanyl-D-alanine carboxypeptidase (penicillin-binding protein 5/6)